MSARPALAAALVGALLAATLTACAPQSAASPTPTPRFTSQAQAFAAAEKTYRAYVDALNRVDLSDPKTFEGVYEWTTGDRLANDKKALTGYHSQGATMSGETTIARLVPGAWDAKSQSVTIAACVDVSTLALHDATGQSIVSPDRPSIQSVTVHLLARDASKTGLLIDEISGRSGQPKC